MLGEVAIFSIASVTVPWRRNNCKEEQACGLEANRERLAPVPMVRPVNYSTFTCSLCRRVEASFPVPIRADGACSYECKIGQKCGGTSYGWQIAWNQTTKRERKAYKFRWPTSGKVAMGRSAPSVMDLSNTPRRRSPLKCRRNRCGEMWP